MVVKQLIKHKQNNSFKDFYAEIEKFLPQLRRYVKQRLHLAEQNGIIPKNFYAPEDIIDEVYQEIYGKIDENWTEQQLKNELFSLAMQKLDTIIKKEAQKPQTVDIDRLIEQELKELEEKFTVDADGELVLEEELDDISYKQDEAKPQYLILERPIEQRILEMLDKDTSRELTREQQQIFWKLYKVLPAQSKTVVELYVFGGLSIGEISQITRSSQQSVDKVVNSFTSKLRKLSK